MSGIAGIVSAEGAPPDAGLLEKFADALSFRGPDARRVWTGPSAGLCFTFLRTGPAPQRSEQPYTLNGRTWLLADARLDGREALLSQLKAAGQVLAERPTEEDLILLAWQEWGESCLDALRGDFAFVLWDGEKRALWCVRDPMGAKPFYYAHTGSFFYFSNTLDVLRLAPEVSAALDPRAVGDFLLEGWISDAERTIFRDVRRLPAGCFLRFTEGQVRVSRYAKLPIEEPLELPRPEEYVEVFREVFTAAVRDRLPRDSAAVFLSGGLDSTSVAALAKSIAEKESTGCSFRAFTVDYRPLFEDEEGYLASRVAAHIGIPIEILDGSAYLPFSRWGSEVLGQPEPCNEPYLAMQIDQYRQVAAHARVAFSGDGGDSILTGQAWPHLVSLTRKRRWGTLLRVFGGYILSHGRIPPLRGGFRTRVRKWLGRRDPNEDYPVWLNPEFERKRCLRELWSERQRNLPDEHPIHPVAYRGLTNSFWPSVLEGEDAEWTGVPVESRAPFLDWRVLRFLLRVPPVPWCMEKELLRQTMRGLLPGKIVSRRKTPLMGDPLVFHLHRGDGLALHPAAASPVIHQFVNWPKLEKVLAAPSPEQLWSNLRPLSLNYWLKREFSFSRVARGESG